MWPKAGFSRISEQTDYFMKCPIELACKEGDEEH